MKVFTVGTPASGALFIYILNILDGFHFTPDSLADHNRTTLTYQRMIETFKYAYALRNDLGDKDFVDMKEVSIIAHRKWADILFLKFCPKPLLIYFINSLSY